MKYSKNTLKTGGRARAHGRGFALVASLTLMMLLGLIAVGILAVASSQNRIAAQTILQEEARQQALIGLDAAIASMQMELGPDQRVTASSGILSAEESSPQHILGVWESWKAPLYSSSDGATIASTYNEGRSSMFRRWLISCRDLSSQRQLNSISDLGRSKPGQRICMIGEGTLGTKVSEREYVYADLITMPSSGRNETCFAWWVGGENQKANVAIADREPTSDPVEILHRTWDTPAPDFSGSSNFSFLPEDIETPEKILTMRTLPLVDRGSAPVGMPYFFDATTFSYSLLTNVRDGGLKLDLNTLLSKRSLSGTGLQERNDQDCPIAEGDGLPSGTESKFPIGSWQTLHAFYNLWPDGSGQDRDFTSFRLIGNLFTAHTRMGGYLQSASTDKGDSITYYDERASIDGQNASGYARTPILLAFYGAYGLALSAPKSGMGGYSHGTAYAPFMLWWNPYNVQMRVGPKKLWTMSLPYRTTSIVRQDTYRNRWDRYSMLPALTPRTNPEFPGSVAQGNVLGCDWGNYFVVSQDDQSSDIIFEPGEILMFSMAEGWNNLTYANEHPGAESTICFSQPQEIPFVQGDQVGLLHNYFQSFYSFGTRFEFVHKYALETKEAYSQMVLQLIDDDDGKCSDGAYMYDTVGEVLGPKMREAFAVPHGFNGIDSSQAKGLDPDASRKTAKVNSFPGAEGLSPYVFNLGWYDYDTVSADDVTFIKDAQWDESMYNNPYYFAAVGVAPKSYNASLSEALPMFVDKNYRTRNWLHSNPAMGGGALYKPDEQQRQYHPFQLSAIKVDGERVLDTVNTKNGIYGIASVGVGGGEAVSFISVLELPVHPPFSLAGFAGMRLKPGWYSSRGNDQDAVIANMRRMQYQAGVPGVGIGNSFADPTIPADAVYAFHQTNINASTVSNRQLFSDFFDHGFIINDALWDRWFCSSVSDMPTRNGRVRARATLESFVNGEEPLPVSRYKLARTSADQDQIIERIMADDGWKRIARYLMVEGGFNVNSVSEDAWAATLMGLAKRELVSNTQGTLHAVEHSPRENVLFSRFGVSTADRSMDLRSDYNVLLGAAFLRPSMQMATAWGDVRSLTPDSIRELAREIVKKVRERGPFLNMAEFINRRLDGGSDASLCGALQAAIDATRINDRFNLDDFRVRPLSGDFYKFPRAEEGSMYTAAPGYLIQSDVLASLGNILTVRDDTFTVRAYGCVRNARHAILAQAWCEAVVQRTIDFVDPSNSPEEGSYDPSSRTSRPIDSLSEINQCMGRKLRIVSFKWLDSWNI